jgi:apolipoprotein N-acyltransferase
VFNLKSKRALFYITAGVCLGLAFPPINLYTLQFIGYALLIHFLHTSEKFKQAFFRTYTVFLVFNLISVSWLFLSGLRENADRFMILGGFLTIVLYSVLLTVPFVIYYYSRKGFIRLFGNTKLVQSLSLIYLPFICVSYEYFSSLMEQSFPWLTAGNAFTSALAKIQFIEITGVYGLSFWAYVISCMLYLLIEGTLISGISLRETLKYKSKVVLLIAILVVYFLPDFYTAVTSASLKYTRNKNEKFIRTGIIQPNINPYKKWGAKQMDLVNDYSEMIRAYDTSKNKPDMLILPETAVPFHLLDAYYSDKYRVFKNLCDSINIPLLVGTLDIVFYNDSVKAKSDSKENKSSGQKYDVFNSAVLMQPGEEKISHQKYEKMKLVFASERMPYQDKVGFLRNMIHWTVGISSFQIGWDTTVFNLKGKYKFNTAICYESIYPEFFSVFVNKGAEFCVIITNDAWWGKLFGTYQHNSFAVLRAIENRRWIARCANTGISCTIDPYGNMYDETPINEKVLMTEEVGLRQEKTFYTMNPFLIPHTAMLITGIMIVLSVGGVFRKRYLCSKV